LAKIHLYREAVIEPLTSKQRAHLRSLAHHLKAVLQIGKEGVTESTVQAVEDAFNTRELLKVKIQEAAPQSAKEAGPMLAEQIEDARWVQTIGRTVVLYRPHPKKPEIRLPR
jgi:RNA-binding protein